ncbi:hypothetical protein AVEN_122447-2-1, partial [Araneus ventricosus]
RIQFQEFQNDKNSPEARVLQLDFAMNYSCSYQDEVQSALLTRKCITLFTAAVFVHGKCNTHLICSVTSEKENNTVRAFIENIYEEIQPNARENNFFEEIIWTNGSSSKFKNRDMTLLLQDLRIRFKKTSHWKYFATAHGKGVVDGIGGAITPKKQNVDNMPVNTINISTGNWVVVKYDESLYAGEVTQVLGKDIELSTMKKSGKFWEWPKREDKVFYNMSEVIQVIQPPTVINTCGDFDFPDIWKICAIHGT